jgi:hypothetical protein
MNSDKYIDLCKVTESKDYYTIRDRINDRFFLTQLKGAIKDGIRAGERLDHLKKYAFYGKDPQCYNNGDGLKLSRLDESKILDIQHIRVLHGIIGMFTEAGELLEMYEKYISDDSVTELDIINLVEETGDSNWYQSLLIDTAREIYKKAGKTLTLSWESIWTTNINKLILRFGDMFKAHNALNRNLNKERELLTDSVESDK